MKNIETLKKEIDKELAQSKNLFPEYLAEKVCKYIAMNEGNDSAQFSTHFIIKLTDWHETNLLSSRIDYAKKLMIFPYNLEYEELSKLFSLFDGIESMHRIGLPVALHKLKEYQTIQLSFITQYDIGKLRMIIMDKSENWKAGWLWYDLKKINQIRNQL